MIRIAQKDFRIWLRRNGGKIVGDPTDINTCPLCRFLKSRGAKKVRMSFYARFVDGRSHNNTVWARKFQQRAIEVQRSLEVTGLRGREALTALNDVTQ